MRCPEISGRVVQDATALLAADDLFAASDMHDGGGRYFHVAAGANLMVERDHCRISLARKKSFEPTQQIFINLRSELSPFLV